MTQYVLLIHGNARIGATPEEWNRFLAAAKESGLFRGGSEIGNRSVVGEADSMKTTDHIVGFMRFDAEDEQSILHLLEMHPVVVHGGTVELCEMPKSEAE